MDSWRAWATGGRAELFKLSGRAQRMGCTPGPVRASALGPIATFTRGEATLVLVPGGRHRIGAEPDEVLALPRARDELAAAERDMGHPPPAEYLAQVLGRPRGITLDAFLIELAAEELDEDVPDRRALGARLRARGMTVPTSAQWEVACRAGATSLFYWGDDWTEATPLDAWQPPPHPLGLTIAVDPYRHELVREKDHLRGGDGGVAVCGGLGGLPAWIALACAYRDQQLPRLLEDSGTLAECWVRGVIELD
jgi:hypothetical protein